MEKRTFTVGKGSIGIVIPIALCRVLGIEPGAVLDLSIDTRTKIITLKVKEQ